jgi:ABC-type nitrate/sulfonate/bicarbonate transport system substrate-binding protein
LSNCQAKWHGIRSEVKDSVSFSLSPPSIRIGFIPLLDAAPLIAAQELGLFRIAGLDVRLRAEPGWATIYDKFVFGEFDAMQLLAGQALDLRAGRSIGSTGFAVPLFLNRGGSCIVLSKLWIDRGITTAKQMLMANRSSDSGRRLTFGAVHRLSSHGFLLQNWLREAGAKEDEIQIINLPPSLMARNIHSGHLDGICVGEPWCTHCMIEYRGSVVAIGDELAPNHPDKVFVISGNMRQQRHAETLQLLRCIFQAAAWCDETANHPELALMLEDDRYLGLEADMIERALSGNYDSINNGKAHRVRFNSAAMSPSGSRLTWLAEQWHKNQWDGTKHLPQLLDSKLFAEAMEPA